eukprot:5598465-Pleurochrysis_carterae.AAC.3
MVVKLCFTTRAKSDEPDKRFAVRKLKFNAPLDTGRSRRYSRDAVTTDPSRGVASAFAETVSASSKSRKCGLQFA